MGFRAWDLGFGAQVSWLGWLGIWVQDSGFIIENGRFRVEHVKLSMIVEEWSCLI